MLKTYLQEIQDGDSIQKKIIEFFKNNSKPSDDQIHAFSERMKINPHKFEEIIYEILGSFFGAGRAKDFKGSYDSKELASGIKIEMEHTTNKLISERIAKDHLAECSDYYTRLAKMEAGCEE